MDVEQHEIRRELRDLFRRLDAIVGLRGRRNIGGEQWFVTYYADVGAGDSDLTWQANVGAGYAFGWGDVVLAYRYLDYDEGRHLGALGQMLRQGVESGRHTCNS